MHTLVAVLMGSVLGLCPVLVEAGTTGEQPPEQSTAVAMLHGSTDKETQMHKLFATFTLAVLIATPLVTTAAGADRTPGSVPAAVDQLLAQDMIQQAQMHLKLAGLHPGRTDGVFDSQTAEAVRQYQAARGIPVSGLLDEPTRQALFPGLQDASEN